MPGYSFIKDDQYVLNYSAKYLARRNTDRRHAYGPVGVDASSDRIAERGDFPSSIHMEAARSPQTIQKRSMITMK